MKPNRGPVPNLYQLHDGRLIAGEYPGDRDDGAARAKVGTLLDAGITCFVDLTESYEPDPYDRMLANEAAKRGVDARHVRLLIVDVCRRAPRERRAGYEGTGCGFRRVIRPG